jgi:hypothetical protein
MAVSEPQRRKVRHPSYYYVRWFRGADRICAVRRCGTVLRRHSCDACCMRVRGWCAVTKKDSTHRCHPLRRYICCNRHRNNPIRDVQALKTTTPFSCAARAGYGELTYRKCLKTQNGCYGVFFSSSGSAFSASDAALSADSSSPNSLVWASASAFSAFEKGFSHPEIQPH